MEKLSGNHPVFDRRSILFKILIPVASLMIMQMLTIMVVVLQGSAFKTFNERTISNFQGNLDIQKAYIESDMTNRWGNLSSDYRAVETKLKKYLEENASSVGEILQSEEHSVQIVDYLADDIFLLLRKNNVTGAFFVLDNAGDDKYGIFLRDYNPDATNSDNSDIVIEICPLHVKKNLSSYQYDTSVNFQTRFDFANEESSFFDLPLKAGKEYPAQDISGLGYWADNFSMHGMDAISYQVPMTVQGEVLGVLGVTIDKRYIVDRSFTTVKDIPNIYLMRVEGEDNYIACQNVVDVSLKNQDLTKYEPSEYEGLYRLTDAENKVLVSSKLNLYTSSAYYGQQTWVLVGVVDENLLFQSRQDILHGLMNIFVICLSVGLIGVYILAYIISKPILNTAHFMEKGSILDLKETGTTEVDHLIVELKKNVNQVYSLPMRLSRILDLANVNMAVFEYLPDTQTVSVTQKFFPLFGKESNRTELSAEEFDTFMNSFDKENLTYEGTDETFYLKRVNRWLRIRYLSQDHKRTGVVHDVTSEIQNRQMIEHERDYDILTGLLNRRGFHYAIDRIWNEDGVALMVMMDLDNLKYVNDKYGHDFGDDYINLVGNTLKNYASSNLLTCHLSGDEFIVYVHGCESEDAVRALMEQFNTEVRQASMDIYGEKFMVRMSTGMAFKEDGDTFDSLLKKAEFAMYEIKKAAKNGAAYFSQDHYDINEHKIGVMNRFNNMLSKVDIHYAFQPIVDIHTGSVLGYEALMRPDIEEFASPMKVIELAREAHRLKDVESITFFEAMKAFEKAAPDDDVLLFINSLSNQMITHEQFYQIRKERSHLFHRCVVEICEEESQNQELMEQKLNLIKDAGASLAIDDYGTGYNNLATILEYNARYLKIERSLVQDIDIDDKKYTLTKGIVEYCRQYNIRVIAEGVERVEELKTVHDLGVDYVQGFLVQRPSFEIHPLSDEVVTMIQKLDRN